MQHDDYMIKLVYISKREVYYRSEQFQGFPG